MLKKDFISLFSSLLNYLNRIFLKSPSSEIISFMCVSIIKIINSLTTLLKEDMKELVKNNSLLTLDLLDLIYNIIKQTAILRIVATDKISEVIQCMCNFFDSHLLDSLVSWEMREVIGVVVDCINEYVKHPEKDLVPLFVLELLYKCSYWGVKKDERTNSFSGYFDREIKNKFFLDLFIYFDKLSYAENEEKIVIRKWYCSVTFGFLNKGRSVEEKYWKIMVFLKEVKEGTYPVIDLKKKKIAGDAFDFVNNAKDFTK
jgi:hypothetical protein